MTLINSNQYRQFSACLPIYSNPALQQSDNICSGFSESESRFEQQIQSEIINLHERRAQLSSRLAQAKLKAPSAAQKQDMLQEYALLEQTRKFLSMIVEAIEKSRQGIAANLR